MVPGRIFSWKLTNWPLLPLRDALAPFVRGKAVPREDGDDVATAVASLALRWSVATTALAASVNTAFATTANLDVADERDAAEVSDALAHLPAGLAATCWIDIWIGARFSKTKKQQAQTYGNVREPSRSFGRICSHGGRNSA